MFCENCGKQLPNDAKFCNGCGAVVAPANESAPQMVPPSAAAIPPQIPPMPVEPVSAQPAAGENVVTEQPGVYVKKLPIILIAVVTIAVILYAFLMNDEGGGTSFTYAAIAGCAPALALLIYIYRLDRIEHEPISLLLKLLLFGALSAFPAVFIEEILGIFLDSVAVEGSLFYKVFMNFVIAAMTEELCKYAALRLGSWKHKAFNFRFDGVVYSATTALGFAAFENVLYIMQYGRSTALLRAVASIPGHCMYGIYVGFYYGQAKSLAVRGDTKGARALILRGLGISILMHGFYDFVCDLNSILATILYFVVVAGFNVLAYINLNKFAQKDQEI